MKRAIALADRFHADLVEEANFRVARSPDGRAWVALQGPDGVELYPVPSAELILALDRWQARREGKPLSAAALGEFVGQLLERTSDPAFRDDDGLLIRRVRTGSTLGLALIVTIPNADAGRIRVSRPVRVAPA